MSAWFTAHDLIQTPQRWSDDAAADGIIASIAHLSYVGVVEYS